MIKVINLNKSFGNLHILKDINFEVKPQEKVVIIGPSGSGKSTLLKCLHFLEEPDTGEIYIDGKLLGHKLTQNGRKKKMSKSEIAEMRSKIGMVFQSFNLFPHKTVLDNVTLAPRKVLRIPKEEANKVALDLLKKVGLENRAKQFPGMLSGGEQQRVAISRALAMGPKIMLFDEVTSALDPELTGEVLAVMRRLAQEGMTMVIVSHEMDFALEVADRMLFVDEGRIVVEGKPEEILRQKKNERLRNFLDRFVTGKEKFLSLVSKSK
jgi:polar amino acid transport system ATP-binding protein